MLEMETPITRAEHEEFVRRLGTEVQRLDDEDSRQNKRLDILESNINQIVVQQLMTITTTIEKLNLSVNNLLKEQAEVGERLKCLEARDGMMWQSVIKYALSALIGGGIAFLLTRVGM